MNYAIFDIDGVLADFESELVYRLSHKFGEAVQYIGRDKYTMKERYGHDKEVLQEAIKITSSEDAYKFLNQDMSAVKFVREADKKGYDILILTSRDETLNSVTLRWLNRILHGVNFDLAHSLNKMAHVFEIKKHVSFVVDDNPAEVEDMKKVGIPAFCWEQPWNDSIYPKLFPYSSGVAVQMSEDADAVDFWSLQGE